ncbi:MAG: hypothetical protein GY934_00090, partial [Gammaproteobacteria bacterium]|nr:hypothetical protein [Gammaproteobacteria bacterium]
MGRNSSFGVGYGIRWATKKGLITSPFVIPTLWGSIAFQENEGLVVIEAENGQRSNGTTHNWLYLSALTGYTGTSYLQPSL